MTNIKCKRGEAIFYVSIWGELPKINEIEYEEENEIKSEIQNLPVQEYRLIHLEHPFNDQDIFESNGDTFSKIKVIEKEDGHYSYMLDNIELRNGDRIQAIHCNFSRFLQSVFCYDNVNKRMILKAYEAPPHPTDPNNYFSLHLLYNDLEFDNSKIEKFYRFRFITETGIKIENEKPKPIRKRRCCSRIIAFFGEDEET